MRRVVDQEPSTGFFSRLAASRRRQQAHSEIEHNPRHYFWRKKKLKDNSWWCTFLTNWGRYILCLTTPLTCASVPGVISWVFLMYHCVKKSCAFLKYHLNQEIRKKTWLSNWYPLYKNVNALMKCNTRAAVGMTVSMEPWQTSDRAFRVNLLKSNVHRL